MPVRKEPFATGYWYHIFNRGVDRSAIFRSSYDYHHFLEALSFYRYRTTPMKLYNYLRLSPTERELVSQDLDESGTKVTLAAFALMLNHFHLLVRQDEENGIHALLFKAMNSFSQYLNNKRKRVGPVFQGNFQAIRVTTDEQLLHVSRYIHLNPVVAGMISMKSLATFPWTSYPVYLGKQIQMIDTSEVIGIIGSEKSYREFVENQESYAKSLAEIKHLLRDESIHLGGGIQGESKDTISTSEVV